MLSNLSTPRRTPSSRNLEIYALVKIRGCSQTQVAADHKLTQSRVSRIVAQVEAWRLKADAGPDAPTNTERRRHERWLARERWEMIFQRSLMELNASARTLTSERSGERDGKAFRETTQREQAANVQWMKTAIKAGENLLKLSELEPLAQPQSEAETPEQKLAAISHWLTHQLAQQLLAAEERVPSPARTPSYVLVAQARATVQQCLADLLGPPATDPPAADPPAADPPAADPLSPRVHAGASAEQPLTENCHNCHTPAAAMTPADAGDDAAELAATPGADNRCVTSAAPGSVPPTPSTPPKNPPTMTPDREPWEDEYERLMEARKTIRLPMGAVVRS